MKNKILTVTMILVAVSGVSAASPFEISFDDDPFFSQDSFFDDDPFFGHEDSDNESDQSEDSWFNDPFFSDSEDESSEQPEDDSSQDESEDNGTADEGDQVTEERHVTPAPEPDYVGDDYISYPNPRDHYKHSQNIHREGSIKVCKILLNQNGEVITGTSVNDVHFTVDTDIPYSDARPVTFSTEIDQVADLVGSSEDLIEGDGYLDAECAEFHDLPLNRTYNYSEEEITGEDSGKVENVGYEEYWEREKPPLKNPQPYGASEGSDGQVTLTPGDGNRHAEIIIVNQLSG